MDKYKCGLFFMFLVMVCSFNFVFAMNSDLPLMGKVIYLDPGHGGIDPGATYKEIREANINLDIVKVLYERLLLKGATVYLTRYGDYDLAVPNAVNRKRSDLSRRGNLINKSGCDLYISIHLNADTSSSWYGAQVFYDDVNSQNEVIARIMQKRLGHDLRTVRKEVITGEMYLHKRVKQPGILIEVGFITNANERYLLRQSGYQKKVADSIVGGVLEYFSY